MKTIRTSLFIGCLSGGIFLASCNNTVTKSSENTGDSTTAHQPLTGDSTAKEAAYNFIDACVESSKARLGEAKAFAHCKCLQGQIQAKYGNTDSTTIATMQKDSVAMAQMLANCK